MSKRNPNTDTVRKMLEKKPSLTPTQIVEKMANKGIEITPRFATDVKYNMGIRSNKLPADYEPVARGRSPKPNKTSPRAGAPKPTKRGRKSDSPFFDKVSLTALKEAKQFMDSVGGAEEAIKILNTIDDIGGLKKTQRAIGAISELI